MRITAIAALMVLAGAGDAQAAETIRLGVSKLASCAPIAIAIEKGYFAAEGLDPQLTYFDAQQPIAVAVTSGDIDFGIAAETAALYNLAGGGKLRIIAGGGNEAPSFHYLALIASDDAYASGLKSPHDLAGHSFALTQMGSGLQYILSQIAEKSGFDLKTVKLLPLQSNANVASAIAGGRADSGAVNSSGALPLLEKGDAKLLGWTGDLTGVDQAYLVFASAKMADEHGGTVRHLLAAYRNASRDYYAAFTDAKGMRADGPTATATLAIIAKYLGQPPDVAERGLPYFDAEGRIDVDDVQRQIDWYRAQGFIRGDVTAEAIVDDRYIVRRHGQSDAR